MVIFRKKVNIFFFKENVNKVFPQNTLQRLNAGQWKPHVNAAAVPAQATFVCISIDFVGCSRNSAWVENRTCKKQKTIG